MKSIPNFPFHVIKFATLVIGMPILMYYPEYIPLLVQINIVEAVCQDLMSHNVVGLAMGVIVAATTPMLTMHRFYAMMWGVAYMIWHLGFCHRINFRGAPPVIQNIIPFVLLCFSPQNLRPSVWLIGRTVAILQHQSEALVVALQQS